MFRVVPYSRRPRLSCSFAVLRSRVFRSLAILAIQILSIGLVSNAQSDRDVRLYEDAITTLERHGDPIDLQRFVSTAPFGHLKDDGLQWLVWQFRTAHDGRAKQWAEQLLKTQPENALALAAASDPQPQIDAYRHALRNIDLLKAPQGMSQSTFQGLKTELARDLNGYIGYTYYQRNDLVTAREYLRRAISVNSTNYQYTYALAISDLYGKDRNEAEGFEMLARTVNLSKGAPQSSQLAEYARQKYLSRGGSEAAWNQYLQNTATGAVIASGPANASSSPANSPASGATGEANKPETVASTTTPNAPNAAPPEPTTNAAVLETTPPGFPVRTQRPLVPAGAPFSLGILVETSKTSPGNRRAVVNSLTDMVRHLREEDEAFVVSFSRQVVFEQDLTGNSKALESAIDNIKPDRGTALLDAVAFAAGHLSRIAKNQRKVLLVISDGENGTEQGTPLEVSGELNSSKVEIYCIGMGAESTDDRYRLEALARRTGGQAVFIDGNTQFRRATQQVAANLGVPFP